MKTFTELEVKEMETCVKKSIDAIGEMLNSYWAAQKHFNVLSEYMPESCELKFSHMITVKEDFRQKAWSALLWKTRILDLITEQRKKETEATLTVNKKEFTAENITEFLNDLKSSEAKFIAESREQIKNYQLGNKINIPRFIENIGTNYERGKIISLLINLTYHYMGRPLNEMYYNEITDAIKAARTGYSVQAGEAESENFKLKWFANSNLHIVFKNAEVFKKITE